MRFNKAKPGQVDIQLAPMIDVVFLLLIFFIVSWRLAKFEGVVDISVPKPSNSPPTENVGEIIINVFEDGRLAVNERWLTRDQLIARLQQIHRLNPEQPVILRGFTNTHFEHIVDVLDACNGVGLFNVAFAEVAKQPALE